METQTKEKPYTDEEVEAKIKEHGLEGWYLDGGWLRRKYNTDGWPTTLMLVNTIGYLSEAAYHHPDLAVTWGKVWVKLKTHTANGITELRMALRHWTDLEAPFEAARSRRSLALAHRRAGDEASAHAVANLERLARALRLAVG